MLAPKGSTYDGRPTFANPMYLKKAQSEKPCLYDIPYDKCDLANLFAPDKEETLTLEQESISKLNKDLVKPYDYTKQNSLYENFKPPSREYLDQLAHANEVRTKMWRKYFVKNKPNIVKNIAWEKHTHDKFRAPTTEDMTVLLKTCLMPLALKTQNDSFKFVDAHTELQCLYLHKIKECDCLAAKLLKQTENVSKEVYNELSRSFAKLEKHSFSLELALQQCQEQIKHDKVWKQKESSSF
ncbi:hypothetical protein Tco_0518902 [Tanacetum coccineum]